MKGELELIHSHCLRISEGRDSDVLLEHALQVRRRKREALAEPGEGERLIVSATDVMAHTQHALGDGIAQVAAVGLAALAGAKSGLARQLGRREEPHVLSARFACWTGRPAIDPGGTHAEYEAPVVLRIPLEAGAP